MKKKLPVKSKAKTREVRRTFFTTPEINLALIGHANEQERSVSNVINLALKSYLGI